MVDVFEASIADIVADGRFDAEFYQPQFRRLDTELARVPTDPLTRLAQIGDGNHAAISHLFTDDPNGNYRYLRGQDIGGFFLSQRKPVYVAESAFRALQSSLIKPRDVLLSIVGTVGALSLVPADSPEMTGSCKLAILRVADDGCRPEYLAAFLASRYGQTQIRRLTRGAVQTGLLLADMGRIRVARLGSAENEIADAVADADRKLRQSRDRMDSVRQVLAGHLGWSPPNLDAEERYTAAPLSRILEANRWDSEYFALRYARHMAAVRALPDVRDLVPAQDVIRTVTNGHTPLHHDLTTGEVRFLTAENVVDFGIDYGTHKRITYAQHRGELARTALSVGDVLFTIKGRVGDCAPVAFLPEEPVNINQDVALLRLDDEMHPFFFAAWFNSTLGRPFVEQAVTGAINPFVGLHTLRRLPFPVVEKSLRTAIGEEVRALLEEATADERAATAALHKTIGKVEERIAAASLAAVDG